MRSFFVLVLLGVVLATIGLVVRSGIMARKHPGQPINGAMRAALAGKDQQWPDREAHLISLRYNGARDTDNGLRYLIRSPGTGTDTPQKGQVVTVNYEGRFLETEKIFDTSANHDGPFNFRIGEGAVIPGMDAGILSMKKGEKRTLLVPYWLAYGDKGVLGRIPVRAALVFEIELLDFK